jgi:hypothetical protein
MDRALEGRIKAGRAVDGQWAYSVWGLHTLDLHDSCTEAVRVHLGFHFRPLSRALRHDKQLNVVIIKLVLPARRWCITQASALSLFVSE